MDRFPLPHLGWSLLAMGSVMGADLPHPEMKISRGVEVGDWQFDWHGVKGWTYFLQQSPNALERQAKGQVIYRIEAPYDNSVGPFAGAMSYVDDPINQQLAFEADPNEERKAVIFVHGWRGKEAVRA